MAASPAMAQGSEYVPLSARCRVADSRQISSPIPAGATRQLDVTGNASYAPQGGSGNSTGCGIPDYATAFAVSLTVLPTGFGGFFKIFPNGGAWQDGNTINFTASGGITNDVMVASKQASVNELDIYSNVSTHYVVDIVGYFARQAASVLDCTNTTVSNFTIGANTTNFYNNPSCPAGYNAVTPYCWTAVAGVFSQGSGFNANNPANTTFCAWQNTTGGNQTVFGGNVCCRVPGR
ncbi:hypothetical protein [Hydrogenophaga pseudoflava]|uniref:hypothetical protein n=1 Tax=Hydrogenophaga pseudoflava TaxID=47421 RepID=UPI0027E588F5|nr:hypothetical protein [Hydrogenophaga pseudoflava]MDQ7744080.1 hypothetical protein [Hydrogenophaga pseudoflava]